MWLYRTQKGVINDVYDYSLSMVKLINILKGDSWVEIAQESKTMNEFLYLKTSREYSDMIFYYLIKSDEDFEGELTKKAYQLLLNIGWKGIIPNEQRNYYRSRYLYLYPGISNLESTRMLADYLAGSKARLDLGGKGIPKSDVDGYIQINFSHKVPGAPDGIFSTTLYYRTTLTSHSRTHIAPWRAKGYLKIDSDGDIKTKITSWGDMPSELHKSKFVLSNEKEEVEIQADFFLLDIGYLVPNSYII